MPAVCRSPCLLWLRALHESPLTGGPQDDLAHTMHILVNTVPGNVLRKLFELIEAILPCPP
jgi:hypothetical protein